MAVTVTFTIQDNAKAAQIADAFDLEFPGRVEAGKTKQEWVKEKIVEYVRQVTRNNLGNTAAGTARQTVEADINSVSIT